MGRLFERENGTPMLFYLADLPVNYLEKYTFLIETNGGIVEPIAKENVLTLTLPSRAHSFKFVFSVKFIEDCVDHKRILDINKYYVGDSRLESSCLCVFSKMVCKSASCLLNRIKASKVPESQKETSKRARDISPVCSGKKRAKPVVESSSELFVEPSDTEDDTESNTIDAMEIVETRLSDTSEDNEHITEPHKYNEYQLQPVPSNFKVLESKITPEIMQWIKELNEKRPKDEFGYPKKTSHTYIAWESRNLIDFVEKTNTFDMVFSESYWSDVAQLKLVPIDRTGKSLYAHFIYKILEKIEELPLDQKLKSEFVHYRESHKAEMKKKNKVQKDKLLSASRGKEK